MSFYAYDPFPEFDRLFDAAWNERTNSNGRQPSSNPNSNEVSRRDAAPGGLLNPRMDLHSSKSNNLITATFELPGLKKEDVSIDLHDNQLIISGVCKMDEKLERDGYIARERRFGRFVRGVKVPPGIEPESIKASMEDGVLTVRWPRESAKMARKVTIS